MAISLPRTLVLNALLNAFLEAVTGNLLIILLKRRKVLAGFRKLAFFHTLTDIPMYECALRVHEVKLVVESAPGFGDGSGVRQHADGAVNWGKFAARYTNGLLVIDAKFETGWAPLDEVEGGLGLEGSNGGSAVARNDVAAVEEGDGHVLAVTRVAHNHLVVRFEACVLFSRQKKNRHRDRHLHWNVRSWTLKLSWEICWLEMTGA